MNTVRANVFKLGSTLKTLLIIKGSDPKKVCNKYRLQLHPFSRFLCGAHTPTDQMLSAISKELNLNEEALMKGEIKILGDNHAK